MDSPGEAPGSARTKSVQTREGSKRYLKLPSRNLWLALTLPGPDFAATIRIIDQFLKPYVVYCSQPKKDPS